MSAAFKRAVSVVHVLYQHGCRCAAVAARMSSTYVTHPAASFSISVQCAAHAMVLERQAPVAASYAHLQPQYKPVPLLPLQCAARTWCWSGSAHARWATPPPSTKPRTTRMPTTMRECTPADPAASRGLSIAPAAAATTRHCDMRSSHRLPLPAAVWRRPCPAWC